MKKAKFYSQVLQIFFLAIFFTCFILPKNAEAGKNGGIGRLRSCNNDGIQEGLDYNPFNGGKDVEFVMSNPVCISVVAYAYALTKYRIAKMNTMCQSGDVFPRFTPSPIQDTIDISRATVRAGTTMSWACAGAVAEAASSLSTSIAIISIIYGIANNVYENTSICGSNWIVPNPKFYINNAPMHKIEVENAIFGKDGYIANNRIEKLNLNDKTYREWYYGGVEVDDSDVRGGYCRDVNKPKRADNDYPAQKYYMKGLETGNFNCKQYYLGPEANKDPRDGTPLSAERIAEYKGAYECCKARARKYICIDFGGKKKFCEAGSNCVIRNDINGVDTTVTFATKLIDNGRLACAETYSLCPYNFAIGGGSEICDFYQDGKYNSSKGIYDIIQVADVTSGNCTDKSEIRNPDCTYNEKAGRCKNYCQFMRHCTKTDLSDYQYTSSITSPYFSSACFNFEGDSQNKISFGTGFIAGSARHFSAPIAQCTKETLENIFYNRAGHTACRLLTDSPANNNCPGGTIYKKGDQVMAKSFFAQLQDQMQFVVKLVLTLSITFFGVKILLGGGGIKKSDLLMYVIKIGLVMYFATGDAWQTMFFDGIYGASTVFSQMVFKAQTPADPTKRDGCQFGNVNLDNDDATLVSVSKYPLGKEYLAIWDTLDCKITRYLGFGPELSTANVAKLIFAGFFTHPIGIYFSLCLLLFGLILISCAIRALHIFLSSAIAILIMVYVSPLVIPLSLFKKTNGIFKGWLKQIISFSLQPMILFAYLAIFVSVMDKTLIGSATFYGDPPFRAIQCASYCQDALGNIVNNQNCDGVGQKFVTPKADSIACMVSNNAFGNWPGLELIGIALPFLLDFLTDHIREKILTIIKAVLVMYFLYQFLDEVPGICSQLIGGATLPGSKSDGVANLKSLHKYVSAIQQRANRAAKKWLPKGAKGARNAIRNIGSALDKGKSVEDGGGGNSVNSGGSSGGGGGKGNSSKDGNNSAGN